MIIKPPTPLLGLTKPTIFLAGSIEMGVAEEWQTKVGNAIESPSFITLNPRRDYWDASWKQDINNPQFKEQVTWEMDGLMGASLRIFYFDPSTKSPITLMELGLTCCLQTNLVCCREPFWRKGNVDILCQRYNIKQVSNIGHLIFETIDWQHKYLKNHC